MPRTRKEAPIETKIACTSLAAGKPEGHPLRSVTPALLSDVASNTTELPLPVFDDADPGREARQVGEVRAVWTVVDGDGHVGLWARVQPFGKWEDGSAAVAVIEIEQRKLLHCVVVKAESMFSGLGPLRAEEGRWEDRFREAFQKAGVSVEDFARNLARISSSVPVDDRASPVQVEVEKARAEQEIVDTLLAIGRTVGLEVGDVEDKLAVRGATRREAIDELRNRFWISDPLEPAAAAEDDGAEVDEGGLARARAELDLFDEGA